MGRKVYLSFLGLGGYDRETKTYYYRDTTYEIDGRSSAVTPFVQAAEMELLDGSQFDQVLIVATQKSYETHFENLKKQMEGFGVSPDALILEEDFSSEGQWKWFEKILKIIEPDDILTIDLTHGYRAVPIVFSAAINFLQKARNISLEAVYYGAFDVNRKLAPIVDMKDFYLINEWADSVSRLIEDADARKMAETAQKTASFQMGELNDEEVIGVFGELTDTIRNVDVNNIARKTNDALELIKLKKKKASDTGKMLLDMVIDKFVKLSTDASVTKQYDRDYFKVQIEIIRLLLEHRLFMQAYTVMREFIASLAMIPFEKEGMNNKKRKKRRPRYGEVFFQMFQYKEDEWRFESREDVRLRLVPFYESLKKAGIENILRKFANNLAVYRNGFDHAWTAKSKAKEDIPEQGQIFLKHLESIMDILNEHIFVS